MTIHMITSIIMTTSMRTAMTTITQGSIITIMSTAGCRRFLRLSAAAVLTPGARALAERIFQILAEAEAKAHGVPL